MRTPRKNPRNAGRPRRIPSYCHHKASGQAYLKTGGRVVYLGKYGTAASRDAYADVVAAILANRPLPATATAKSAHAGDGAAGGGQITVGEVCDRYIDHANGYYVKNGSPTAEAGMIANACGACRDAFGDLPAEAFVPLALKSVRESLVARGLARTTVNKAVTRFVRLRAMNLCR